MNGTSISHKVIFEHIGWWISALSKPCRSCRKQILSSNFVLFYIHLLFAACSFSQTPGLSGTGVVIRRITAREGLPSRLVVSMTQDKHGFIWIGTEEGLWRYNGENSTRWFKSNDSTSLSNGFVLALHEDRDGFLWVGTRQGLNRYNQETGSFRRYFHDPREDCTISNDEIRSIFEDRSGVLWVGTANGLNKFDKITDTWTRYYPGQEDTTRPGDNFINTILEDHQGMLWVAMA